MQNCSHGGGKGGDSGGGNDGGQRPGRHGGVGGGDGGECSATSIRVHISHLSEIVHRGKPVYDAFALRLASSHAMHISPKRHRGGAGMTPQSSAQSGLSKRQSSRLRYIVE